MTAKKFQRRTLPVLQEAAKHAVFRQERYAPAVLCRQILPETKLADAKVMDVGGISFLGARVSFDLSYERILPRRDRAIMALGMLGLSDAKIESLIGVEQDVIADRVARLLSLAGISDPGNKQRVGLSRALVAGSSSLARIDKPVDINMFATLTEDRLRIINHLSQGKPYQTVADILGYTIKETKYHLTQAMEATGIVNEGLLATAYVLSSPAFALSGITTDDILPRKSLNISDEWDI